MRLVPVAEKTTKMRDKRQFTISVSAVTVKQEVRLADTVEPFILGLDA